MISPMSLLNMALNNNQCMQNPIFANAVKMYKSGDAEGLRNLAQNLCNEKGVNPNELMNRLGIKM